MKRELHQDEIPDLAYQLWSAIAKVTGIGSLPKSAAEFLVDIRKQQVDLWVPWAPLEAVPAIQIERVPGGQIFIVYLPLGREKHKTEDDDTLPYWEASLEGFRLGRWHREGNSFRIEWDSHPQTLSSEDQPCHMFPSPPRDLLRHFYPGYILAQTVYIGGRTLNPLASFVSEKSELDNLVTRVLRLASGGLSSMGPLIIKTKPSALDRGFREATLVLKVKVSLTNETSLWPLTLRRWFSSRFLRKFT